MRRFERGYGYARFGLAALVVTLTLAVMLHAIVTVKTPNAANYSWILNPGYGTGPITPVDSQPVWVTGVQTTSGYRGVGRVALLRVPSGFLVWTGLESTCYCSPSTITSGYSASPGTHIVYLDWDHLVDIQVVNADSFQVFSSGSNSAGASGSVTLVW